MARHHWATSTPLLSSGQSYIATARVTAALLDATHGGDGDAWLDLCATWDDVGGSLIGGLLSPFPPVRSALGGLAGLRRAGGLDVVRTLLLPAVDLARERFAGEPGRLLIAGNAGHADIPLDAPGSGLMALLLAMLGQTVGWPVPQGGAGQLARCAGTTSRLAGWQAALLGRGRPHRGRPAPGAGRMPDRRGANEPARTVVADVGASRLYGGLVRAEDLPERTMRRMRRFGSTPRRSRSTGRSPGRCRGRAAPPYSRARSTSPTAWRR